MERFSGGILADSMHNDRSGCCRSDRNKLDVYSPSLKIHNNQPRSSVSGKTGDWQRSPTEERQDRQHIPTGSTSPQAGGRFPLFPMRSSAGFC
jgi:hypothetical protein